MSLFKKSPTKMTLVELSDEISKLTRERKELNAKIAEVQRIYSAKSAATRVIAELANKSDEEKTLILQAIQASGISSQETFGKL